MTDAERDDALAILLAWMNWPLEDEIYIELPSGRMIDLFDTCLVYDNPKRSDTIPVGSRELQVSEIVDSCKGDDKPLSPGLADLGIDLASIMEDGKGRVITYGLLHYFTFVTCGLDSDEAERRWEQGRREMKERRAARARDN